MIINDRPKRDFGRNRLINWLGLTIDSSPVARRSRVHEQFVSIEVHAGLVRFSAVAL